MTGLDVFTCALDGVTLIEASAGTGKTWNLCALYVRLLLEKKLDADQILVVTFTKAATAELHERIRERLGQLLRAIEARIATPDANLPDYPFSQDPFINGFFATTLAAHKRDDLEAAAQQLRAALSLFDQAAIHTIHAFCQRALQEAPFAAAMPFDFEVQADDAALRFDLAVDFWREQVEPVAACYPDFAAWLVENGAGPAVLDAQLARRLKKPLAQLRWSGLDEAASSNADNDGNARSNESNGNHESDHIDTQAQLFDTAYTLWRTGHDAIVALFDAAQASSSLNRNSYKPQTITEAMRAWDDWFAQGNAKAPLPAIASKLTTSALKKATNKKSETPAHEFFTLADRLVAAARDAAARQRTRWLSLMRLWLEHAPCEMAERKRERRVMSFDDLLTNLYHALTEHPQLADTLRARYRAALIDEFQDTDPLQFAIFSRLFVPDGPLFLIGDPKQAIYSFRAADLHTYLAARDAASARHTLAVNQRSTQAMIDACNRLFGANPRAFVLDGLDYQPVRASARQRAPFVDEATNAHETAHTGNFIIWTLPGASDDKSSVLKKDEAQRLASATCAAEIVRLLRGAREGRVKIGDRPLTPAHIAVLVQTHQQGSLMKRTLTAYGIGSVEQARMSVFSTFDAEQIERILAAIDTPGELRKLRAALATDWFGLDAQRLWRSAQPESESGAPDTDISSVTDEARWVERFARYRMLWREYGFAVMWRTLEDELRITQWLVAQPDGERRLTDVKHLAELLQARAVAQPGIAPTLRWFAAQRSVENGNDETQLRLESDRNLVQIVTVHQSKGLEYPVVFCPFINDGSLRNASLSKRFDAREYHDEDGHAVLHYGLDEENDSTSHGEDDLATRAQRQVQREQAAERVRLWYVALTRAMYRCYIVAGPYLVRGSTKESQRSMLNWLVAGDGYALDDWFDKPPDVAQLAARWQAFAGGPVSMAALPLEPPCQRLTSTHDMHGAFHARAAHRALHLTWRLASFSALVAAGARNEQEAPGSVTTFDAAPANHDDARPDHDATVEPVSNDVAPDNLAIPTVPVAFAPDDILNFPRGAAAGECLHRMFELADFADRATWPAAINRALHERPVRVREGLAPHLPAMMQRLLADVTTTGLAPLSAPGMTLTSLDPTRRLNELEFVFPAPALDCAALRRVLREHGYPDVRLESSTLSGFVKGFIDVVFEHDGRYWIIDWKSNHLGDTPAAYDTPSLENAMTVHAYHLQALLYTVALHRYLRARLADYDYDAHCGGYLYLFVRGVRPAWQAAGNAAGIYARRPARALIETLDRLMNGDTP